MRIATKVVLAIALIILGGAAFALLPAAQNTLTANTRLIAVEVVATDSRGNVVRGLTKDDFKRGVVRESLF